jgi:hypothetical protein
MSIGPFCELQVGLVRKESVDVSWKKVCGKQSRDNSAAGGVLMVDLERITSGCWYIISRRVVIHVNCMQTLLLRHPAALLGTGATARYHRWCVLFIAEICRHLHASSITTHCSPAAVLLHGCLFAYALLLLQLSYVQAAGSGCSSASLLPVRLPADLQPLH